MTPRQLTANEVRSIYHRWEQRPTIASLARDYDVPESVIRHIIALPQWTINNMKDDQVNNIEEDPYFTG